ncbi:helix-turn-helix transcriptional regulator [Pseudoxanthomonas japonensis]|uniref:helix-turn-helix transcriptional regulator n=1 Tax=Pseudoxanthomonas japonensis TaxID=69284 RepID=UPI003D2F754C
MRVLRARSDASLTQLQLADLLGINRSAVAQWERLDGGTCPSIAHLCKIADVTKVGFEWLATGRGTPRRRHGAKVVNERDQARNEYESRCLQWLRRIPEQRRPLVAQLLAELSKRR